MTSTFLIPIMAGQSQRKAYSESIFSNQPQNLYIDLYQQSLRPYLGSLLRLRSNRTLSLGAHGSRSQSTYGTGTWGTPDGLYSQDRGYDQWGNVTTRAGWGGWQGYGVNDSF